ncbi:MAG: M13 family metallopeptidase [Ignavibacteriales bacterium]|nr:M13 family metallopeptidase [Ignavibacteriales bacterium]
MKNRSLFFIMFLSIVLIVQNFAQISGDKSKTLDPQNIDSSVKPGDNFYEYASGNWLKNNPIPDEYSRWGSFEILTEENYKILKQILEEASVSNAPLGSVQQKIGDYCFAGMDTASIESLGINAISNYLEKIQNINSEENLVEVISEMHVNGQNPLFNFFVSADAKNSSMVISQLFQGGLGLPDRDYYLKDDDRSKEIRERYALHISKMFSLSGSDESTAHNAAAVIMKIETRLAENSMDRVAMRDPNLTYNKMTFADVKNLASGFDWDLYFNFTGVNDPGDINVGQPDFFKEIGSMMNEVSLDDWKIYLRWNLLRGTANLLSSDFVNERFDFTGKFLNGQKAMQPRWKRILQSTNFALGEALGKLFVEKTFPPEAKQKALQIVNNLLEAMGDRINNLEWMSDETKKQAMIKLDAFNVKIGYPDKWKDYSDLKVTRNSFVENLMEANRFQFKKDLEKIGKPVDKTEWLMNPQTVNAYYEPTKNEIVFPAAILQPPFFDPEADDAINYGAMGGVIGHEVTHGFDDEGKQYDAEGNIRNWWTSEDEAKFNERAQVMINQYNSFMPIDTNRINGALTQGENIADLGGLNVAFTAFKKTEQFNENKLIDGFTPSQRFFLSWANVWKNNIRDQALLLRLKTDPHSPGKFRVLGPLSNIPEFWDAFDIKPGEPMRNEGDKLVKIW